MDKFMNMTSTVSNWWSTEKRDDDQADGVVGGSVDETAGGGTADAAVIGANVDGGDKAAPATVLQREEEEDESPPTSEADTVSNRSIDGGDGTTGDGGGDGEGENAAGKGTKFVGGIQVGINEVSTKAMESAKNIGSFLFSVANKAGKTVTETAKQLKHTVEENSILGDFNKEQEAFVKEKNFQQTEAAVPPWVGYGDEEVLKQQVLALSLDRRNFLRSPPSGVQYQFDFDAMYPIAMATLAEDPNLEKIRFEVVPKLVNEENFWKNYFYRVSLIKQSTQLSSLAQETSGVGGDLTGRSSRQNSAEAGGAKSGRHSSGDLNRQISDSPIHEFVSDAFQGNVDKDELRKGMQQLGMKGNEEEWEKEVQQELQEYEVVMGGKESLLSEDPEWEKEIEQMLDSEMAASADVKK